MSKPVCGLAIEHFKYDPMLQIEDTVKLLRFVVIPHLVVSKGKVVQALAPP